MVTEAAAALSGSEASVGAAAESGLGGSVQTDVRVGREDEDRVRIGSPAQQQVAPSLLLRSS